MNLFDYFGNMNVFAAGPNAQVQSLLDNKLIDQSVIDKANKQSIGTGLVTGLASYFAQPQNQNYGDVSPYIAKAFLNANKAAQAPFENIPQGYEMDTQIAENKLKLKNQQRDEALKQELLNDPRVQSNPILRAAVFSKPEKVFEILNTPKKPLGQKERLAQLMTMDADPNQTLTNTQRAEMNAIKKILSVGSPTGQSFGGLDLPKPPDGYFYDKNPNGTLKTNEEGKPYVVPVAGSAEARKRMKEDKKEQVGQEGKATIASTVVVDAQRALDLIDSNDLTTGLDAWALRNVPSTKAYALDQMVKSIQANIGIDKLLDIKASGAGLGQVPQSQLEMLASVLGQLNTAQDKETVRYNVQRVLDLYSDIVRKAGGEEALQSALLAAKQTPERKDLEAIPKERSQEDEDLLRKYTG